jgi:glycosyltransferase involved in cell wall biosynthesis
MDVAALLIRWQRLRAQVSGPPKVGGSPTNLSTARVAAWGARGSCMPLLSVLTAAIGEWAEYVAEAGKSLAAQELPSGWDLEWVVQEDGPEPVLADVIGRFPFARYEANRRRLGTATTRNLALRRVGGQLVHLLDCDDLMLPGGLAAALRVFDAHPRVHWVAGQADNLMPDGARVAFDPLRPPGPIEAGELNEFALVEGRVEILPHSLTFRTGIVRALSGWSAAVPGEDTLLLVAVAELTAGYYLPEVTWLYRQHERQGSRDPYWTARLSNAAEMTRQRIGALRETGLRLDPPR